MKQIKYFLFLLIITGFVTGYAGEEDEQDGSPQSEELNERDWRVLRQFVKSKKIEDLLEKAVDLTLSGDVRTEWRHMNESQNGFNLRGGNATNTYTLSGAPIPGAGLPVSKNDFDVEFNLRLQYVKENTWAQVHLQYDNSAGVSDNKLSCYTKNETVHTENGNVTVTKVGDPQGFHGSGSAGDLSLKAAFFGCNLFDCGNHRLDVEVGRRGNLYRVFHSKIQFLQRLDGLVVSYSGKSDNKTKWYWKTAGFVVDERVNQFAWATELGLLNICDSGIDLRYSLIDWRKNGTNRCFARDPAGFSFVNSQVSMAYNLNPDLFWGKSAKIMGAFLINHDADPIAITDPATFITKRYNDNTGWYIAFEIGEVIDEGDWAFQAQYQYVGATAVPDGDSAGICRGNVAGTSTLQPGINRGNTNFRGLKFEALYALTDNLTIDSILEWSWAANKKIGGSHHYNKFEVEAIYAF